MSKSANRQISKSADGGIWSVLFHLSDSLQFSVESLRLTSPLPRNMLSTDEKPGFPEKTWFHRASVAVDEKPGFTTDRSGLESGNGMRQLYLTGALAQMA
jgi:hypothetical protein